MDSRQKSPDSRQGILSKIFYCPENRAIDKRGECRVGDLTPTLGEIPKPNVAREGAFHASRARWARIPLI